MARWQELLCSEIQEQSPCISHRAAAPGATSLPGGRGRSHHPAGGCHHIRRAAAAAAQPALPGHGPCVAPAHSPACGGKRLVVWGWGACNACAQDSSRPGGLACAVVGVWGWLSMASSSLDTYRCLHLAPVPATQVQLPQIAQVVLAIKAAVHVQVVAHDCTHVAAACGRRVSWAGERNAERGRGLERPGVGVVVQTYCHRVCSPALASLYIPVVSGCHHSRWSRWNNHRSFRQPACEL